FNRCPRSTLIFAGNLTTRIFASCPARRRPLHWKFILARHFLRSCFWRSKKVVGLIFCNYQSWTSIWWIELAQRPFFLVYRMQSRDHLVDMARGILPITPPPTREAQGNVGFA